MQLYREIFKYLFLLHLGLQLRNANDPFGNAAWIYILMFFFNLLPKPIVKTNK
jgi:hypothetical protein